MGRLGYNNDDHEFILSSDKRDSIVLTEDVLNWDEDDKAYERDYEGGGTLKKLNTKVEIVGEGVNYIDGLIGVYGYGVTASITHNAKSKTKIGEDWETVYHANLDLMLGKFIEGKGKRRFSVPFTQGGLYDQVRARLSDTFDLVNTKSADNKDISVLSTITEQVKGREIYRRSLLEVEPNRTEEIVFSGGGRDSARAIPFVVTLNSEVGSVEGVSQGSEKINYGGGTYTDGNVGSLIYNNANTAKELSLSGKIKLRITDPNEGILKIELIKYKYNPTSDVLEYVDGSRKLFGEMDSNVFHAEFEYTINEVLNLEQGEGFTISAYERVDAYFPLGPKRVEWEYLENNLTIKNDDSYIPTVSKSLLYHELIDRCLEKITGEKGLLKSTLLGRKDLGYAEDGEWSTLAVASGFWARGFDLGSQLTDENGDIVPEKQFNISLQDAYRSLYAITPLMWAIEKINGKEYFRLEKYEYTQQSFTGVRLGRTVNGTFYHVPANNAERTFLTDNLYTKVEIGYEKGGSGYEEVFGLTAIHGKAEYNTSLKNATANSYTKVSKIRADLEGYELARVKQARLYPDEDTTYDQDLFFRHLKKVGTGWYLRTWEDDFDNAPKNVYSPNTTGNLLLTPLQCAKRHGRIIATSVFQDPYGKFTWISSNCNSEVELDGTKENGAINNSELGEPFITGELMTFDAKVYPETVAQLEGFTYVNGQRIPNWYGVFEFKLNDRLVRGKLIKSSITGSGKHEIALI